MNQSNKDIRFATDPDYVGGAYNGQPNKVEPSSGLKAQGYVPGTFLPFPRLNWQLATLGEIVHGLADVCALNWAPAASTASTTIQGRVRHPALTATQNGVVSFTQMAPGVNLGVPDYLFLNDDDTSSIIWTNDLVSWTISPSSTLVSQSNPVPGIHGSLAVLVFSHSTGNVRYTLDGGNTWIDAGNVDVGGAFDATAAIGIYFYARQRWLILGRGTIAFSDDLSDVEWDQLTPPSQWITAPPPEPTCCAQGPAGVLLGVTAGGVGGMVFTPDGETFLWTQTGAAGQIRSVAYSESSGRWYALDTNGSLWAAPSDASSWTELTVLPGAKAVCTFGRSVLVASDYIYVSVDEFASSRPVGPQRPDAGHNAAWDTLTPFNGSILAGQFVGLGDDDFAWTRSLVAPFAAGLV